MTYLDLKAKAEELLRQAEDARAREIAEVIRQIRDTMSHYGITVADLGFGRQTVAAHRDRRAAVKFRDAYGNTWTGRGQRPRWLRDAISAGKSQDDFRIAA